MLHGFSVCHFQIQTLLDKLVNPRLRLERGMCFMIIKSSDHLDHLQQGQLWLKMQLFSCQREPLCNHNLWQVATHKLSIFGITSFSPCWKIWARWRQSQAVGSHPSSDGYIFARTWKVHWKASKLYISDAIAPEGPAKVVLICLHLSHSWTAK